ncbi:hypothetical protein [Aliiglaciecola aliphaticivorans]
MTENPKIDHAKDWKSPLNPSQNKDEILDELVRILARGAAKQDFEDMLAQENTDSIH